MLELSRTLLGRRRRADGLYASRRDWRICRRLPIGVGRLLGAIFDARRRRNLRLDIRNTLRSQAQARLTVDRVEHATRNFVGDLRRTVGLGGIANDYFQAR